MWAAPRKRFIQIIMTTEADFQKFVDDGYLIIKDFLSEADINEIEQKCYDIVQEMNPNEHTLQTFSTSEDDQNKKRNNYFMESADKIRFFFEKQAVNEKGDLTVDKHKALNKIGHALHVLDPVFKKVTHSQLIQRVAKNLGFKKPVVVQSMYIFKSPHVGGEVVPHQDSTFLYTEPMNILGFWIPLEDCTLENSCLHFIPGSHKNGVSRRMIKAEDGVSTTFVGPLLEFDNDKFIPAEVEKGSLVLIHGEVVHKSEHNYSEKSRHVYTFHIAETEDTKWSKENWLQESNSMKFPPLYQ
ncbi:phytanoyl-CoA dioxygenase domain-containing protein 1-like [Anneissia japonica]|uniref:phytanoyl-CoA dioxygenase domain-containing protein 1-like n=1 Tax=Anneissia japonica TaxID=1529436 RepID=UPI0014258484|nr:phytanoyl-CoA dioxygenase domain-containing protein 1-like [Anneissia japonica]